MTQREFSWCRLELAEDCERSDDHVHICIRSPGASETRLKCGRKALFLNFHDLDPQAVLRSSAASQDRARGEEIAALCMTEDHAERIAAFVEQHPAPHCVVNCEAGISRSPGIVLALRRKYGGDTEECFKEAIPNIYVASTLGKVLGVGPFQARKYTDKGISWFEDGIHKEKKPS